MPQKADNNASEFSFSQFPPGCPGSTQLNDPSRRDQRILDHLALVRAIALRVHATLPAHMDVEDLIHAGVMGLIDAASKFDPAKEVAFPSYAKHRIRGSILDGLRKEDWASRSIRKRRQQLEVLNLHFAEMFHRSPTDQETAERMGVSVER